METWRGSGSRQHGTHTYTVVRVGTAGLASEAEGRTNADGDTGIPRYAGRRWRGRKQFPSIVKSKNSMSQFVLSLFGKLADKVLVNRRFRDANPAHRHVVTVQNLVDD